MNTTKLINLIKELEKNYDFNDYVLNYLNEEELKSCRDIDEAIELIEKANEDREITDTEVIYYSNAIKYLAENDQSLSESMELATDYWYDTKDINSELLASLLQSKNNMDDFGTFLAELKNEYEKTTELN